MKKIPSSQISGFSKEQLRSWDDSDGVNFAIALARITGWLLHVDWWTPTDNHENVNNMKSLRVYVGDNSNLIIDLDRKYSIATFTNNVIRPLVRKRGENFGGVATKYYSEQNVFKLPLRVKPSEERIKKAEEAIAANKDFLNNIPLRKKPLVPAYIAANFTFGQCAPFAQALSDLLNQKATAMIALEYSDLFGYSKLGYAHSIIVKSDTIGIDVWGNDEIKNIAARFGIVRYVLDENEHRRVNQKLKMNSPDKYEEIYNKAVDIIKEHFQDII